MKRLAALATFLIPIAAWAQQPPEDHFPPFEVPEKYSITLETAKTTYFIGENVVVNFRVKNTGDKTFYVDEGGDNRGAHRALRFNVTAADANGKNVRDPFPLNNCFGGFGGSGEVKPGESYYLNFSLLLYADISAGGEYTITASHDLGWKKSDKPKTSATIKLKFVMPTKGQAQKLVDEIVKQEDPGAEFGKKREHYGSLYVLRDPIYFSPLLELVKDSNKEAIDAMCELRSPDATAAMIKLLSHEHWDFAKSVTYELKKRLPESGLGERWPQIDAKLSAEERSIYAPYWKPEHAELLRKTCATERWAGGEWAGIFYEHVGTKEDLPRVIAALDQIAMASKDPQWKLNESDDPPVGAVENERAVAAILKRGGEFTTAPKSAGELLAFGYLLKTDSNYRPENWQTSLDTMAVHELPYVRLAALESIQSSMTKTQIDQVQKSIKDSNETVVRAALDVVFRTGDAKFKEATLAVLRKAQGSTLWGAHRAFERFGDLNAYYTVWVDRLNEPKVAPDAMIYLVNLIEGKSSAFTENFNVEDAARVQVLWRKFLQEHEKEIAAGKKFPISVITAEFIPRGLKIGIAGVGDTWPATQPAGK